MRRAGTQWVMVVVGSMLAGCGGEPVTPEDEPVGEVSQAQGDHNGLSVDALAHNAITANPAALLVLSQFPLRTSTLEGTDASVAATYRTLDASSNMGDQLHDPVAREALKYIVGCALSKEQSVTYHDRFGGDHTFTGEVGACGTLAGATSPAGDWSSAAPTTQCLELVSACLMARTNALGKRIFLSMRGEPSAKTLLPAQLPVFALGSAVATQTFYKEDTAAASYRACTAPTSGPARDCGWTPKAVGRCRAGEIVTIGAGANKASCGAPLGSASGDTMLRVCRGLYGCDMATPSPSSAYAGVLAQNDDACAGTNPSVQFVCPANGPLIDPTVPTERYGYYSVMIAPHDSTASLSGTESVAANTGIYPASEAAVFSYQEGAFFGNMFQPSQLGAGIGTHVEITGGVYDNLIAHPDSQPPVMFKDMHGCYSDIWSDGAAEMTERMCLSSTHTCGINITGACTSRCSIADGLDIIGDGDFHGCQDRSGRSWASPVTTFLNYPCDLGRIAWPASSSSCAIESGGQSIVPPQ